MKSFIAFVSLLLTVIVLNSCAQKNPSAENKSAPAVSSAKLSDEELAKKYHQATFAEGCFWHAEAVFESVKGVQEAVSGYAGGTTKNPTYEDVGTETTGHAETVNVYYDSSVIDYPTLLKVFFASQDPTQVNGQGPDLGSSYRSIAFYRNATEKKEIEDYIANLTASGKYNKPIATQVVPFTVFWRAEDYHQDYIQHHPTGNPYVENVSIPDVKEFQAKFPELIKPDRNLLAK